MEKRLLIVAVVAIVIIVGAVVAYQYLIVPKPPEEEYIKIGFIGPLTGPYSDFGQRMLYSAKMVAEDVNKNGGIMIGGKRMNITLVLADNESKVEKGRAAITELILVHKVHVVVGEIHSSVFLNYMDIPEKHKIPFINTACQSMEILKRTWGESEKKPGPPMKYIFNLSPTSLGDAQADGAATVEHLKGKIDKIALMAENSEAAIEHINFYQAYIEEHAPEIEIVARDLYELGTVDFYAVLAKWKALEVDLAYVSIWAAPGLAFAEQFYEVFGTPQFEGGHPTVFAVTGQWQSKDFIAEHPDWTNLHMADVGWSSDLPLTPLTIPVSKRYNETWGVPMHRWSAQQYDGMLMMVEALRTAGTLDPDAIVEALETVKVTGVRLELEFGEDHYCPTRNVVAQIQNGKHVVIWPPEVATGTVDLGRG